MPHSKCSCQKTTYRPYRKGAFVFLLPGRRGYGGIDFGLAMMAKIGGDDLARAAQLGFEYDPSPPFDSGSVEKASPETVENGGRVVFKSERLKAEITDGRPSA